MLAFYVEWHMREAWRELMFADTDQATKATRDPVAPAKRSASAPRKAASKLLDDEQPAHSFATLMAEMATLVRNTCRVCRSGPQDRERLLWGRSPSERLLPYGSCTLKPVIGMAIS